MAIHRWVICRCGTGGRCDVHNGDVPKLSKLEILAALALGGFMGIILMALLGIGYAA